VTFNRAVWAERLTPGKLARIALMLAVGAAGGFAADAAGVPLAWMLGSLFACMVASMAGAPVHGPMWLRSIFISLIGVFLGESFKDTPIEQIAEWPLTMGLAVLYAPVGAFAAYALYRYAARMSPIDALLSGVPGGLSAIVAISAELGANERNVALAQSLRITFVIVAAPFVAFSLLALPEPTPETFATHNVISPADAAILFGVVIVATTALKLVRLPLFFLIGPLLASAGLRLSGAIEGELPHWLLEIALLVTGGTIGCRFFGVRIVDIARVMLWTMAGTAALLAVTVLFALLASTALSVDFFAALLAYAPGGVAEMSLIAVAIDADPGFVAAHHITRILFILLAAPFFGAWVRRKFSEA